MYSTIAARTSVLCKIPNLITIALRWSSRYARVPVSALARPGIDESLRGVEEHRRVRKKRLEQEAAMPPLGASLAITVITSPQLRTELSLKRRERRGRIFVELADESSEGALMDLRRAVERELPLAGVRYTLRGGLTARNAPTHRQAASLEIITDADAESFLDAIATACDGERAVMFCDFEAVTEDELGEDHAIFSELDAATATGSDGGDGCDGDNVTYTLLSLYRYATSATPLPASLDSSPERYARYLELRLAKLGCLGRIYVANEGVNAQLAVPRSRWSQFAALARSDPFLGGDAPVRLNRDGEWSRASAERPPFHALHVRVRDSIVADGIGGGSGRSDRRGGGGASLAYADAPNLELSDCGEECNPEEWHETLTATYSKSLNSSAGGEAEQSPTPIVVDVRNRYESSVGTFAGARALETDSFRETWDRLPELLDGADPETTPLLLFCTGGIRCEKVAAFAKQRLGFKNVRRLGGGIVNYTNTMRPILEKRAAVAVEGEKDEGAAASASAAQGRAKARGGFEANSTFRGLNYVFDGRVGELVTSDIFDGEETTEAEQRGSASPFAQVAAELRERCGSALLSATGDDGGDGGAAPVAGPDAEERYVELRRVRECVGVVDRRRRRPQPPLQRREVHTVSSSSSSSKNNNMVVIDAAAEREEEDVFWPSFASGFDPAELSLLRDLRAHTERDFESRAHMLPTTSQGLLLSRLCDFSRATTVLEIGTFTGFSALCLAQSSSVERIVTIERDPELVDVVRTFAERSAYGSKIDVRCGAATDILDELREEGALFCLGYLDADKKRTRGLLEQLIGEGPLLRIGGLAIVDNVHYHGEVRRAARFVEEKGVGAVRCDPRREENMGSAMLEFLNATRDDTRVTQLILPAWDGVAICQRVE